MTYSMILSRLAPNRLSVPPIVLPSLTNEDEKQYLKDKNGLEELNQVNECSSNSCNTDKYVIIG